MAFLIGWLFENIFFIPLTIILLLGGLCYFELYIEKQKKAFVTSPSIDGDVITQSTAVVSQNYKRFEDC